jgi:hypothetical protein
MAAVFGTVAHEGISFNNGGTSHVSNFRQTSVTKQRLVEHISTVTDRQDDRGTVIRGVLSAVRREIHKTRRGLRDRSIVPCGGGLEYLHCNPASNKRRRKGNPVSNETVIYGYGSFATVTSE